MIHILDCTDNDLLKFLVEKEFNGYIVKIKPSIDLHLHFDFDEKNGVLVRNKEEIQKVLHIYLDIYGGEYINLGAVLQEVVEDDEALYKTINNRLINSGIYILGLTERELYL